MSKKNQGLTFTDTRQWIYWGAGLGAACLIIALYSFTQGLEIGIGATLAVVSGWCFLSAFKHLQSGKNVVLELREHDMVFPDGVTVRYQDVQKIFAADPYPMIFVGTLNIALTLKPDAPVPEKRRSINALFFQTWVGGNISLIGKKRMVSLMCPGLKGLNNDLDEDELIDEIAARVQAATA